jgi:hypothetical protein
VEGGGVDVEMLMSLTTGGYKSGVDVHCVVLCVVCVTQYNRYSTVPEYR